MAPDAAGYRSCHWAQRSGSYIIQVAGKTTAVRVSGFCLQKVGDVEGKCVGGFGEGT
jgi:hypothetical protein